MRSELRFLAAFLAALAVLAMTAVAGADPGEESHADEIPPPEPTRPAALPGIVGMQLLDVQDKDTGGPANEPTTNSDIAFYGRYRVRRPLLGLPHHRYLEPQRHEGSERRDVSG